MKKQLLKNILTNYLGTFVSMVLGFVLIPFLVNKLGKDAFGLIMLNESFIVFFQVVAFSLRISLSRYATVSFSKGENKTYLEYLATGRRMLFFLAGFVLCLGLLGTIIFPVIFRVPAYFHVQTQLLFFWIIFAFCISIPNIIYWAILYSRQRFDLINIANSGGVIFRALLILSLFMILPEQHANLVNYGLISFMVVLMQNSLIFIFTRRIAPEFNLVNIKSNPRLKKEIISYASRTSLINLSHIINENVGSILVNILWGPSSNALYSVSSKIPVLFKRFFFESMIALVPSFTHYVALNEDQKLRDLVFFYSKLISLITIPISLSLIVKSEELISLWVGSEFDGSVRVLQVLLIATQVFVCSSIAYCLINAYAKLRLPSRLSFIMAIINILISIVLGKRYGLLGIALGYSVATVCYMVTFLLYYACRIAHLNYFIFVWQVIFKPFLFGVALITIYYFVFNAVLIEKTILNVVVYISVFILLYYIIAIFLVLNKIDRGHLKFAYNSVFSKLTNQF